MDDKSLIVALRVGLLISGIANLAASYVIRKQDKAMTEMVGLVQEAKDRVEDVITYSDKMMEVLDPSEAQIRIINERFDMQKWQESLSEQ